MTTELNPIEAPIATNPGGPTVALEQLNLNSRPMRLRSADCKSGVSRVLFATKRCGVSMINFALPPGKPLNSRPHSTTVAFQIEIFELNDVLDPHDKGKATSHHFWSMHARKIPGA